MRFFRRVLELTGIWLILTGAAPSAYLPGLMVIIPAAFASLLVPPTQGWSWRLSGLCRFVPYFLIHSLLAGFEVAWQALRLRPRLRPALLTRPWRVPPGPARVFLANTISLLPGTLSVGFSQDELTIHALNQKPGLDDDLERLEGLVRQLFKLE